MPSTLRSDVEFKLDEHGARLLVDSDHAAEEIRRMRGAGEGEMTTEEIPPAAAFLAGHAHADYRRAGGMREALLPDFLIGAHAAVTDRQLLTRGPRRVATYIPGAMLVAPDDPSLGPKPTSGLEPETPSLP